MLYAVDVLEQPDVFVSGNLLLYYEEDNPRAVVAPDVFVVKGVPNHRRRTYRLWEERKGPDFVLEVTSRSTWREDQVSKRELYGRLGVREYWQYDPTGDCLEPALQGAELRGGRYEALPAQEQEGGLLAIRSAVLGLELHLNAGKFRFYDAVAGRTLDTREQLEARLRERGNGHHCRTAVGWWTFRAWQHTMRKMCSNLEQFGTRGYCHGAERPPRFAGEGRIKRRRDARPLRCRSDHRRGTRKTAQRACRAPDRGDARKRGKTCHGEIRRRRPAPSGVSS